MALIPPVPTGTPLGNYAWGDWYEKVRRAINAAGAVTWANITDFTGSNLTQIQTRQHNSLQAIQGGTTNNYWHLPAGGTTGYVATWNGTTWVSSAPTGGGSSGPVFEVGLTTAQTIGVTSFVRVNFDTVIVDTASCWDATNFRWRPNVPGYYKFQAFIGVSDTVGITSPVLTNIHKNGTRVRLEPIGNIIGSTGRSVHDFPLTYMNGTTDYVDVRTYVQAASGTLTVVGVSGSLYFAYFSGFFVRS